MPTIETAVSLDSLSPTLDPMRSGYTLPVFATASAIAALRCLQQSVPADKSVMTVDLITPPERVEIAIE
jgi:cobalt-precorrin-5B (C1)-methyltransferase